MKVRKLNEHRGRLALGTAFLFVAGAPAWAQEGGEKKAPQEEGGQQQEPQQKPAQQGGTPPKPDIEEILTRQESLIREMDTLKEELQVARQDLVRSLPEGHPAKVRHRSAIEDRQADAARLDGLTLEPEYYGFIPIPNTTTMVRFNFHPRVDATWTDKKANPDRFVTDQIPVDTDADYDSPGQFNLNSRATAITFEAVAPGVDGNPRFFYKNDFFGSTGSEYDFRVQHLYAEYYNFVIGQTFSAFEDPDIWPDTVDFEGPNSMIFARFPVFQKMFAVGEKTIAKVGIEQPDSEVENSVNEDVTGFQSYPDVAGNLRWEDPDSGHIQFGAVLRQLGADSPAFGEEETLGWGLNLSSAFDVTERDTLLGQITYGEGIGRYGNDTSFEKLDAAFDNDGDLEALEYGSLFFGYTHHWNDHWRSTATYGWVNMDNVDSQGPDAFDTTEYATVNLVWRIGRTLTVGGEIQWGSREVASGADGDLWGFQLSVRYSLF